MCVVNYVVEEKSHIESGIKADGKCHLPASSPTCKWWPC